MSTQAAYIAVCESWCHIISASSAHPAMCIHVRLKPRAHTFFPVTRPVAMPAPAAALGCMSMARCAKQWMRRRHPGMYMRLASGYQVCLTASPHNYLAAGSRGGGSSATPLLPACRRLSLCVGGSCRGSSHNGGSCSRLHQRKRGQHRTAMLCDFLLKLSRCCTCSAAQTRNLSAIAIWGHGEWQEGGGLCV